MNNRTVVNNKLHCVKKHSWNNSIIIIILSWASPLLTLRMYKGRYIVTLSFLLWHTAAGADPVVQLSHGGQLKGKSLTYHNIKLRQLKWLYCL